MVLYIIHLYTFAKVMSKANNNANNQNKSNFLKCDWRIKYCILLQLIYEIGPCNRTV